MKESAKKNKRKKGINIRNIYNFQKLPQPGGFQKLISSGR